MPTLIQNIVVIAVLGIIFYIIYKLIQPKVSTEQLKQQLEHARTKDKELSERTKMEDELAELKAKTSPLRKLEKISQGLDAIGKDIDQSGFGINPDYTGGGKKLKR